METDKFHICSLPPAVLGAIFSCLPELDAIRARQVCSAFKKTALAYRRSFVSPWLNTANQVQQALIFLIRELNPEYLTRFALNSRVESLDVLPDKDFDPVEAAHFQWDQKTIEGIENFVKLEAFALVAQGNYRGYRKLVDSFRSWPSLAHVELLVNFTAIIPDLPLTLKSIHIHATAEDWLADIPDLERFKVWIPLEKIANGTYNSIEWIGVTMHTQIIELENPMVLWKPVARLTNVIPFTDVKIHFSGFPEPGPMNDSRTPQNRMVINRVRAEVLTRPIRCRRRVRALISETNSTYVLMWLEGESHLWNVPISQLSYDVDTDRQFLSTVPKQPFCQSPDVDEVVAVEYRGDSRTVLLAHKSGIVVLWNIRGGSDPADISCVVLGKVATNHSGTADQILSISHDLAVLPQPDDWSFIVGTNNGTVARWHVSESTGNYLVEKVQFENPEPIHHVKGTLGSENIVGFATSSHKSFRVFRPAPGSTSLRLEENLIDATAITDATIVDFVVSPDGSLGTMCASDGHLNLYELGTSHSLFHVAPKYSITAEAAWYSPLDYWLFACDGHGMEAVQLEEKNSVMCIMTPQMKDYVVTSHHIVSADGFGRARVLWISYWRDGEAYVMSVGFTTRIFGAEEVADGKSMSQLTFPLYHAIDF